MQHLPHVLLHRYDQDAVSVRRGGIVNKLPQWRVARKKWLLAVEDPQVSGRIALHVPMWHSITAHGANIDICSCFSRASVARLLLCQLGQ
jgi:hypothetical protein